MSRLIPIGSREGIVGHAKVDDDDFERLSQYKWHMTGKFRNYPARAVRLPGGRVAHIKMHREILGLTDSEIHADHINGDTLDNRRCNLRATDRLTNARNRRKRKPGTSAYLGVHKRGNRWMAKVRAGYLGMFDTEEEAAAAVESLRREAYGEAVA